MPATGRMLKTTEAAVVASVDLRDVNRAIDEGILPERFVRRDDGRLVAPAGCALISFYFESATRLTSEERRFTIELIEQRFRGSDALTSRSYIGTDWTVRHEFLIIDFAPFVKGVGERLDRLWAAQELVTSDPEILSGTPVFRGTRVPVHDVAASVAAGLSTDRILAAYPGLDVRALELASIFAKANPLRGRPRIVRRLPTGAVVTSDRRAPRRLGR